MFRDLRWGVYVTFAAGHEYVRRCFQEYGIVTDSTGEYASMWQALALDRAGAGHQRGECRGAQGSDGLRHRFSRRRGRHRQRALKAGEMLDGEGGYTVWGKLMRAEDSLAKNALPIGLAHKVKLVRDVVVGATVTWGDVAADENAEAVKVRREMEKVFGGASDATQRLGHG